VFEPIAKTCNQLESELYQQSLLDSLSPLVLGHPFYIS
jgi:hypothetical protein